MIDRRRSRSAPLGVRVLAVLALLGLAAAGCDGDDGDAGADGVDEAGVYAAIIRAAAPERADGGTPVVYLSPHGDSAQLPLETQVEIIERVGDEVTVRFVDTDEEAIDHDADDDAVLDGGVLLRVGDVPEGGSPVSVTAERISSRSERAAVDYTVSPPVTPDDDEWTAVPGAERPLPTTVPPAD